MRTGPARTIQILVPAAASFAGGAVGDLVDLDSVKTELNITASTDDGWLRKIITGISASVARHCSRTIRTFAVQTYIETVRPQRGGWGHELRSTLDPLQLSAWPLTSLPSPAETAPPQAPTLSAANGGALGAQRVYVRISYVTPYGETAASQETSVALNAGQLAAVAAPGGDVKGFATGWNVYAANASGAETLQNATPIAVNTAWTQPAALLTSGAAPPNYPLAVENLPPPVPVSGLARPLIDGVDFVCDPEPTQLTRLDPAFQPRAWGELPLLFVYSAGYATIPPDVQDAVILLIKARWFARTRDPLIRARDVTGVMSTQYFFGSGPGAETDMPPDVEAKLERYRVPVIA